MTAQEITSITHRRRTRKIRSHISDDINNPDMTIQKRKSILKRYFNQESDRQNYSSLIAKGRNKVLQFNSRISDPEILEKSGKKYNSLIKWKLGCTKLNDLDLNTTNFQDSDYICILCSERSMEDFQVHLLTSCPKTELVKHTLPNSRRQSQSNSTKTSLTFRNKNKLRTCYPLEQNTDICTRIYQFVKVEV